MASFMRRVGRRVAGIGVAAGLIVLGLEAPASALPPTITSFSPTSGPAGCVVVITGTNFDNPPVSSVDIGGTPASAFKIVSGTEIWATVAGGPSGTIHVTNASDTATSTTNFTVVNPGDCSPTITSLTPCTGSAGTVVTIAGTNLLKNSGTTIGAAVGADVRFAPYSAAAAHTGTPETPTQLSVLAPPDVADGLLRVSTFNDVLGEGAVLSDLPFLVPPPDITCFPSVTEHARRATLSLRKHLVVRGAVSVSDEFTDCTARVPVKVQRRISGQWKTVGKTTTNDTGAYKRRIKDRPGKYRARAAQIYILNGGVADICQRATSLVRMHRH